MIQTSDYIANWENSPLAELGLTPWAMTTIAAISITDLQRGDAETEGLPQHALGNRAVASPPPRPFTCCAGSCDP
ncbi:hypothetical protein SAMN04488518_115107 [Pseudovibrio ascidiaceicola]|uniref:Uncharacterized protein n=1 Tax=Pseudovibrio ascidiaceicola TaxID=285279 RepID=A0A1I4EJM3_9HYPH|nr:hypothetical protein SAMN04488518_115107 [Pseudovibrio ascidiaceicola]